MVAAFRMTAAAGVPEFGNSSRARSTTVFTMLGVALVAVPVAIGFSQTSIRTGPATMAPGPVVTAFARAAVANQQLLAPEPAVHPAGRVVVPTPKLTPMLSVPGEARWSMMPSRIRWLGTAAFAGPWYVDRNVELGPVENV